MRKLVKSNLALSEILILVVAIFAFVWMVQIDTGVGIVSAGGPACWEEGGICINTSVSECGGELIPNLCPGSNEIRCCIIEQGNSYSGGEACGSSGTCTSGELCIPSSRIIPGTCLKVTEACCGEVSLENPEGDGGDSGWDIGNTANTVLGVGSAVMAGDRIYNWATGKWESIKTKGLFGKKVPGQANEAATTAATTGADVATTGAEVAEQTFTLGGTEFTGTELSALDLNGIPTEEILSLGKDGLSVLSPEQIAFLSESPETLTALYNDGFVVYKGNIVEWESLSGTQQFFAGPGGTIVSGVLWAAAVAAIAIILANQFASVRNAGDITNYAIGGAIAGAVTVTIWALSVPKAALIAGTAGPPGWVAGLIVAVVVAIGMALTFQDYSKQIFTFYPTMWQPSTSNYDCEACNRLELAGEPICSEYACHSYGLACKWVNDETQYEACVEVGQGDEIPPMITPLKEAYGEPVFPNDLFRYTSSSAGVRIIYEDSETNGCVPAFTPITIAFKTDEKAHCKYSIEAPTEGATPEEVFAGMKNMNEGAVFTNNHTDKIPSSLTASENSQNAAGYSLVNGGFYKFYVRCMDIKENINDFDYTVEFCVHTGPDLNPPEIIGTNPPQDSYIRHGVQILDQFQVYTNEPATCKWDTQPKRFRFMDNDFDSCSRNVDNPIRGYDYGCQGTLTGFVPEQENTYYIACIDQPELVGTPRESQRNEGEIVPIKYRGSQELIIEAGAINGKENNSVVSGGSENIPVTLEVSTSGGAENGKSRCKHSNTGSQGDYAYFFNDGNPTYINPNTQEFTLTEGDYEYFVKCEDSAGNIAASMFKFSVQVDDAAPQIVRIYKENNALKLVTNEQTDCYYTSFSCSYDIEEGTRIPTSDGIEHTVEWATEDNLYIKCVDAYGSKPPFDECSLIARPFEILDILDAGDFGFE